MQRIEDAVAGLDAFTAGAAEAFAEAAVAEPAAEPAEPADDSALRTFAEEEPGICVWTLDPQAAVYVTDCQLTFQMAEARPREHATELPSSPPMRFCCYCGRRFRVTVKESGLPPALTPS